MPYFFPYTQKRADMMISPTSYFETVLKGFYAFLNGNRKGTAPGI